MLGYGYSVDDDATIERTGKDCLSLSATLAKAR
jgi:hypothetical protein